jgi:hypothetical protein
MGPDVGTAAKPRGIASAALAKLAETERDRGDLSSAMHLPRWARQALVSQC